MYAVIAPIGTMQRIFLNSLLSQKNNEGHLHSADLIENAFWFWLLFEYFVLNGHTLGEHIHLWDPGQPTIKLSSLLRKET